jgi:hypothetical protein
VSRAEELGRAHQLLPELTGEFAYGKPHVAGTHLAIKDGDRRTEHQLDVQASSRCRWPGCLLSAVAVISRSRSASQPISSGTRVCGAGLRARSTRRSSRPSSTTRRTRLCSPKRKGWSWSRLRHTWRTTRRRLQRPGVSLPGVRISGHGPDR